MDKDCIDHAVAAFIEAEKRKRAARQPVMTVGDYGQLKKISMPGTIVGFKSNADLDGATCWLQVLLTGFSKYSPGDMFTVDIPVRAADLRRQPSLADLRKEITLTLEIPDYD